jgi:membrane fusion protein, multidrug efflux system
MNATRHAAAIVAVAAMLAAIGCSKNSEASSAPGGKGGGARAVPVSAVKATKEAFPIEIQTFGTAESFNTISIKPQVTGSLTKVKFDKGQYIKKGQPLFELDSRPFEANLQLAQANLARDKVQADNAKRDLARVKELLVKKIASQDECDKAQALADALDASLKADDATVETMKLQKEYCFINCPIDGRAGDLQVDEGNIVKASETSLVVVKQVKPIEVRFSIPQQELWAVRKQMKQGALKVDVAVPGAKTVEMGDLTFVDNAVDKGSGMVQLAATVANDSERIWPGQYVNVALTLSVQQDAVVVPTQAVQIGRDGRYVYVLKPGKSADGKETLTADIRPVTVGPSREGRTVITKGVSDGEWVVTDGQSRLMPGGLAELRDLSGRPASKPASGKAEKQ